MGSRNDFRIPQQTLEVSRARAQLTRLLRRLQKGPRVYLITQSGKPAGALVNLDWLRRILARAGGEKPFSLFGQATAAEDWEQSLEQRRQALRTRTLDRHTAAER